MFKFKRNKNRHRVHSQEKLEILKLLPNIITIMSLIVGLLSVRFAFESKWEYSVYCIMIAACLDGIDGRIARILNASSKFGAELDSLCDFVNFGVCPTMVIYMWTLSSSKYNIVSWFVVTFFCICMCIRLARFNTMTDDNKHSQLMKKFFLGVPAPIGGILGVMPIILDLEILFYFDLSIRYKNYYIIPYYFIISILVVSRIPTFSLKNVYIKPRYVIILLVFLSMTILSLFLYTWVVVPLLCFLYLFSIGFSCYTFYHEIEVQQQKTNESVNS